MHHCLNDQYVRPVLYRYVDNKWTEARQIKTIKKEVPIKGKPKSLYGISTLWCRPLGEVQGESVLDGLGQVCSLQLQGARDLLAAGQLGLVQGGHSAAVVDLHGEGHGAIFQRTSSGLPPSSMQPSPHDGPVQRLRPAPHLDLGEGAARQLLCACN